MKTATDDDKPWFQSKKFLALIIVLVVILVLGVVGIIYQAQIAAIISSIVAFASSHQLSQGVQDGIAKWKAPAMAKAQELMAGGNSPTDQTEIAPVSDMSDFNEADRYANR